jgi:hypothetical protein
MGKVRDRVLRAPGKRYNGNPQTEPSERRLQAPP